MTVKEAITQLRKPGKVYVRVNFFPMSKGDTWVEITKKDLLDRLENMRDKSMFITNIHFDGREPGP